MKLKTEGLQEKLLEVVGDEEFAGALHESAAKLAPDFGGKPSEFAKAVYTTVRDSGFKVADGAMYNLMAKILNESLILDEAGGDQSSSSESGKPEVRDNSPSPPKKIKVALKSGIASYGGQFFDRESKTWIGGTKEKPQEVPATVFVLQKLANGELIEVE